LPTLPDRFPLPPSEPPSFLPSTGDVPDEMFLMIDLKPRLWLSLIDL
jgi:hypothetical protein